MLRHHGSLRTDLTYAHSRAPETRALNQRCSFLTRSKRCSPTRFFASFRTTLWSSVFTLTKPPTHHANFDRWTRVDLRGKLQQLGDVHWHLHRLSAPTLPQGRTQPRRLKHLQSAEKVSRLMQERLMLNSRTLMGLRLDVSRDLWRTSGAHTSWTVWSRHENTRNNLSKCPRIVILKEVPWKARDVKVRNLN